MTHAFRFRVTGFLVVFKDIRLAVEATLVLDPEITVGQQHVARVAVTHGEPARVCLKHGEPVLLWDTTEDLGEPRGVHLGLALQALNGSILHERVARINLERVALLAADLAARAVAEVRGERSARAAKRKGFLERHRALGFAGVVVEDTEAVGVVPKGDFDDLWVDAKSVGVVYDEAHMCIYW